MLMLDPTTKLISDNDNGDSQLHAMGLQPQQISSSRTSDRLIIPSSSYLSWPCRRKLTTSFISCTSFTSTVMTDITAQFLRPATTDDLIFGYLSPANLIAYSKTCKYIREAVASFYRRAFRIENTLCKYFTPNEVVRFRELQEITGDDDSLSDVAYQLITLRDDHLWLRCIGILRAYGVRQLQSGPLCRP